MAEWLGSTKQDIALQSLFDLVDPCFFGSKDVGYLGGY